MAFKRGNEIRALRHLRRGTRAGERVESDPPHALTALLLLFFPLPTQIGWGWATRIEKRGVLCF
jgi:hypothetical protein